MTSKFMEAVHYIIECSSERPHELGATKLAKSLFYAELEAYRRHGKPITGTKYIKEEHGPMPAGMNEAIRKLSTAQKVAERRESHYGFPQRQFWSLETPEFLSLSAAEVAILGDVTRDICKNHTARSISALSHNAAWEAAMPGEEIPFAAFLIASGAGQPTPSEMAKIEAAMGLVA